MPHTVWRVPAYLPYLQPSLDAEAVSAAQQQLGVVLPDSYLALLRQQNGGYVRYTLNSSDVPHSMIWGIGPNFPSITDYQEQLDPETAETGAWVPANSERLVPFDGDGHWYLCLDYRDNLSPSVAFVDVELEQDRQIAPSFDSFLQALRPDAPRACIGILQDASFERLAEVLGIALGARFEDQGDESHGYSVARAALGSAAAPAWVWISPNLVPRGFIRRSDRRYAELAGSLPGLGLRAPEHPDIKYFVEYSNDLALPVQAAVEKAGLSHQRFE